MKFELQQFNEMMKGWKKDHKPEEVLLLIEGYITPFLNDCEVLPLLNESKTEIKNIESEDNAYIPEESEPIKPKRPNVSNNLNKREKRQFMLSKIMSILKRPMAYEQIRDALEKEGIPTPISSLHNYISVLVNDKRVLFKPLIENGAEKRTQLYYIPSTITEVKKASESNKTFIYAEMVLDTLKINTNGLTIDEIWNYMDKKMPIKDIDSTVKALHLEDKVTMLVKNHYTYYIINPTYWTKNDDRQIPMRSH